MRSHLLYDLFTFSLPHLLYSRQPLLNLLLYASLILMYKPLCLPIVHQDNNTALHIAADIGRVAIVQVLIDRNANINALGKVRMYLEYTRLPYRPCAFPTPRISFVAFQTVSTALI